MAKESPKPLEPTPPAPPAPASAITFDELKQHLECEWENYLSNLGQNSMQARLELKQFLTELQPDMEDAINSGDARSLNYLNVRIRGRILSSGLQVLSANEVPMMAIIHAVISTIIAFV